MAQRAELVGRKAERERLTDAVDNARRGAGSLVLIAGDAGIGKTRLVEEVGAAAGRGSGRCSGAGPAAPARRRTRRSWRRCALTFARIPAGSMTAGRCARTS